jgi:hypothetical protein
VRATTWQDVVLPEAAVDIAKDFLEADKDMKEISDDIVVLGYGGLVSNIITQHEGALGSGRGRASTTTYAVAAMLLKY